MTNLLAMRGGRIQVNGMSLELRRTYADAAEGEPLAVRAYVQNFGSYNKTYGTIGGVIVLLTWMYYSMFVLLAGGELASELHHGSGATEPTKGDVYLGRIVSDSGPGTPSLSAKGNRVR